MTKTDSNDTECWFQNCSQRTILEAKDLQKRGCSMRHIAEKTGFDPRTIARFIRAYDNYGIDRFADDVTPKYNSKEINHGSTN